jgi:hypothetical protein
MQAGNPVKKTELPFMLRTKVNNPKSEKNAAFISPHAPIVLRLAKTVKENVRKRTKKEKYFCIHQKNYKMPPYFIYSASGSLNSQVGYRY